MHIWTETDRESVSNGTRTSPTEEGKTGMYAMVCAERLSGMKTTSLREQYQELDPETMDMHEYQKPKWDPMAVEKDIL